MIDGNLLKSFLQSRNSSKLLVLKSVDCTFAQFTNEVKKKSGELGFTHSSEWRLGGFNIRLRMFYEIAIMFCF